MEVILATIFLFFSMAYHPSCTGVWPGLLLPQVGNHPLNSHKGESSTPWRRRTSHPQPRPIGASLSSKKGTNTKPIAPKGIFFLYRTFRDGICGPAVLSKSSAQQLHVAPPRYEQTGPVLGILPPDCLHTLNICRLIAHHPQLQVSQAIHIYLT